MDIDTDPKPQSGAGVPFGLALAFELAAGNIAYGPNGSLAGQLGFWPGLLVRSLVAAAVGAGVYKLAAKMTRPR
jgi:hypothetical protein